MPTFATQKDHDNEIRLLAEIDRTQGTRSVWTGGGHTAWDGEVYRGDRLVALVEIKCRVWVRWLPTLWIGESKSMKVLAEAKRRGVSAYFVSEVTLPDGSVYRGWGDLYDIDKWKREFGGRPPRQGAVNDREWMRHIPLPSQFKPW